MTRAFNDNVRSQLGDCGKVPCRLVRHSCSHFGPLTTRRGVAALSALNDTDEIAPLTTYTSSRPSFTTTLQERQ